MAPHEALSVADAERLANECGLDAVLVYAYIEGSDTQVYATWGRSPENKQMAALMGDVVAKQWPSDEVVIHEDFRSDPREPE